MNAELIRTGLREWCHELLRRAAALHRLPKAQVLIVNPAQVAVAVGYEYGRDHAPQVLAKGVGALARKMRQRAGRHGIAVVEHRALAHTLYRETGLGATVPEETYADLARILVWVELRREGRAAGAHE
jgi:flagellar biosynthetic protein FlhB